MTMGTEKPKTKQLFCVSLLHITEVPRSTATWTSSQDTNKLHKQIADLDIPVLCCQSQNTESEFIYPVD